MWKRYCRSLEEEREREREGLEGYGRPVLLGVPPPPLPPLPPPPVPTHETRPEGVEWKVVGAEKDGGKGMEVDITAPPVITEVRQTEKALETPGDGMEVLWDAKMEEDLASENSTDSEMVLIEHKDKGKEREHL